jgi:hypothetical protein
MMTASILFAQAKHKHGNNRCYFCGSDCDETYKSHEYVKDTFTNRDIVKFPQSKYVCQGCVESIGWGEDEMLMLDGSIKHRENDRGMAPRMYSWILTMDKRIAFTKAHIALARDLILYNPPEPPFSIIIADSGQKQLIFRAPVSVSKDVFPVMLEDEIIEVVPEVLAERIALTVPIVAATGKPALLDNIGINTYIAVENYLGDTAPLEKWEQIRHEPMSRLAAWLAKSKEDAQNECPRIKRDGIPAKNSRTNRPSEAASGNGTDGDKGRSDQAVLDFS